VQACISSLGKPIELVPFFFAAMHSMVGFYQHLDLDAGEPTKGSKPYPAEESRFPGRLINNQLMSLPERQINMPPLPLL